MKTLVFFRKPLVPVFWPSIGCVGTVLTANFCVEICKDVRKDLLASRLTLHTARERRGDQAPACLQLQTL